MVLMACPGVPGSASCRMCYCLREHERDEECTKLCRGLICEEVA